MAKRNAKNLRLVKSSSDVVGIEIASGQGRDLARGIDAIPNPADRATAFIVCMNVISNMAYREACLSNSSKPMSRQAHEVAALIDAQPMDKRDGVRDWFLRNYEIMVACGVAVRTATRAAISSGKVVQLFPR